MNKIWDELDKLGIFVTVAEKGKISDAAAVLNSTQPSISRAIQKLENSFECQLFVRSREGVRLTRSGKLLYDRTSTLLKELTDLKTQVQDSENKLAGNLIAGTYESLAEYLWPDFLMLLRKEVPELNLSIRTGYRSNPVDDLSAGRIDLLVDAEPQTKGGLTSWPLYSDRFAVYASTQLKLKPLNPNEASEFTILYVRDAYDENRMSIENHLELSGCLFKSEYCSDSFSTVKRLAAKGMGLAVLPTRLANEDEAKKLISRVDLKGIPKEGFGKHTICATVSSQNEKEPRIRKIISLLKSHFR